MDEDTRKFTVCKSVPLYQGVMDRVFSLLDDFKAKTGREPAGFVMGPNEYLSLTDEMAEAAAYKSDRFSAKMECRVCGIPVHVKQGAGVEVVLPYELIPEFAIGEIKPEPPPRAA